MSFASVTIIMACLIIMGSVSLLAVNIDALIKDLENQNEVVAFVDDSIENIEEAKALEMYIWDLGNVSNVEFVSRTDAMDAFMSKYDESLMEGIDETVFRHRFVIQLADISLMAETEQGLRNIIGIAKVNAHLEYCQCCFPCADCHAGFRVHIHHVQHHQACYLRQTRGDRHHEDGRCKQLLYTYALHR